jgi:hypothetical protein
MKTGFILPYLTDQRQKKINNNNIVKPATMINQHHLAQKPNDTSYECVLMR